MRDRRGFSFNDLLVTVAALILMGAILLPALARVHDTSGFAQRVADQRPGPEVLNLNVSGNNTLMKKVQQERARFP